MELMLAILLFFFALNGLLLMGIVRQKYLLELEKRAKVDSYNNLFRFRNWRDR
jgi:hypothetical protein